MNTIRRYIVLLIVLPLAIFLGSCAETAENEHLPEYCQTYSGFMSIASKDLYDLVEGISRDEYLTAISVIELDFEVDEAGREIDLNGIQCFQNLTSLTLRGQSFKDISPISALKNIQKISLIDTSVVSIDSFKNLSKIKELTISGTKTLQSVKGVEEMTKLTSLELTDNGIVNVEDLNNLVNLTELNLSYNAITSIPNINRLTLLENLNVSFNNIDDLGDDLSGLSELRHFIAGNNDICDLSTLGDLVSLETLDLGFNNLGCDGSGESPDFSSLENATNLTDIYLNDNNLVSISGLEGYNIPLETLYLHNNLLTDITPISEYTGINELVLYGNMIQNISNLSGMTNLNTIDLSENMIIDFSDLLSIPNLEMIDLSDNLIVSIPDLVTLETEYWPHLVELDLTSNQLTDTSGVEGHSSLSRLILSNNGLVTLSGISNLPELSYLEIFWDEPTGDVEDWPEDYEDEDNPNVIHIFVDTFNNVPNLPLQYYDEYQEEMTNIFDFGFETAPGIELYNSIGGLIGINEIDFTDVDISFIDENSINLPNLSIIDISDSGITDIRFILGNPNLLSVNISNTPVANLSVISGSTTSDLDKLEYVYASFISGDNNLVFAFIDLPELSLIDLTGTNIVSIDNSFNSLNELTTLRIDSTELESITYSFNDIFSFYNSENSIEFVSSKIGVIENSFNRGEYNHIAIIENESIGETSISNSFNELTFHYEEGLSNSGGLIISGNTFSTITVSFNDITALALILEDNNIEVITESFVNLDLEEGFALNQNKLETVVGLDLATNIPVLILNDNHLTTVSFIDGINGLEFLDISNQINTETSELTLLVIDGINNMPSLIEIDMSGLLITEIDGFKNIGITEFVLSKDDNNGGIITSITSDSFSSSQIVELDLYGHDFDNIDFLNNFINLADLKISVDLADISDFDSFVFKSALLTFTLSNVQDTADFSYLSDYDNMTFFSFESDATLGINNFDGLDSLNLLVFDNRVNIVSISNSFNTLPSLTLAESYLDFYNSLSAISHSFDIYTLENVVPIAGSISVVDSFNNLGSVILDSNGETTINFDALSFDNMFYLKISLSNQDSFSVINNYSKLETLEIWNLEKSITDLDNGYITELIIVNMSINVDTITASIDPNGLISLTDNSAPTITLNTVNTEYSLNNTYADIVLNNHNSTSIILSGDLVELSINSTTVENVTIGEFTSTDMIFTTESLLVIDGGNSLTKQADTINVSSSETNLDIEANTDYLEINDVNATNLTLDVNNGNSTIGIGNANLSVDFTGTTLTIPYDSLSTLDVNGVFANLNVDSNLLATATFNDADIETVILVSEELDVEISGTTLETVQVINPNIISFTANAITADVVLATNNDQSLDLLVNVVDIIVQGPDIPIIIFDSTSTAEYLDISVGEAIHTVTYNDAIITDSVILTNTSAINITGTGLATVVVIGDFIDDINVNVPNANIGVTSLETVIIANGIADNIEIIGNNMTNFTVESGSTVNTLDLWVSPVVSNINLTTADIEYFNLITDVVSLDIIGSNVASSSVTADNLIAGDFNFSSNDFTLNSSKTGSTVYKILAETVDLNLSVTDLSIDNASNITDLGIFSSNLATLNTGTAVVGSASINNPSTSLDVSGTGITNLLVSGEITTFNANVDLLTDLTFTHTGSSLSTITTTSNDISVLSQADIEVTSSTLTSSTLYLGSNLGTMNLTTPSLDFTINGITGDLVFESTSMDNLIIGANFIAAEISLINTNVTSIDLSPGIVNTLVLNGNTTSLEIVGGDLQTASLNMANVNSLVVNSDYANFRVSLLNSDTALNISGVVDEFEVNSTDLTSLTVSAGFEANEVTILNTAITSLDFTPGTVGSLDFNGDNSASLNVNAPNIEYIRIAATNMSSVTTNSTFIDGGLDILTAAASLDLNGAMDFVFVDENILSSLDLTDANYRTLSIISNSLDSLNTHSSISELLTVSGDSANFTLVSDVPLITITEAIDSNLNFASSEAIDIDLITNADSVILNSALTTINLVGDNLTTIDGTVDEINFESNGETGSLTMDLEANVFLASIVQYSSIVFDGVNTIETVTLFGGNIDTINTNSVAITTLEILSSEPIVEVNSLDLGTLQFSIGVSGQTLNTNTSIILLDTNIANTVILNYSGVSVLDVNLGNVFDAEINLINGNQVILSGGSTTTTVSGALVDTVTTTSLVSSSYTMNDTLITDLTFLSVGLIAVLTELEINTLDRLLVSDIIDTLRDSSIVLYSPLLTSDIYDMYYDEEHTSLTNQEVIDEVRYDGFRDTAILNAFNEFRLNEYFNYINDTDLNTLIDGQVYGDMQSYLEGYVDSIGTTEAQLTLDEGEPFVQAIRDSIQATLDQTVLVIVEVDLETSVENSIIDDSNTHATTESGLVGFTIG